MGRRARGHDEGRGRRRAGEDAAGSDEQPLRRSWLHSGRAVPRFVLRPLQAFLETEYGGAVLLLIATVVALVWANSPAGDSYERLWHTSLTLTIGPWSLSEDLRAWVNDALMTLFFFVVGLEIKRELVSGELRDRRAAALPAVAAVGGMAAPALLYLAFNSSGPEVRGWGIPMATDIAFALGALSLVGRRVPASLKAFLLALAIVDDIGAIVVIAIFYSGDIEWQALAAALALLLAIQVLQRLRVTWYTVYWVLGIGVWLATLQSGVHATIAGVALGLMTPAAPFQRSDVVRTEVRRSVDESDADGDSPDRDAHRWLHVARLSHDVVSPLVRLENLLHPWTSFVVIPVFALANAGVQLSGEAVRGAAESGVAAGIVVGLVVGKPLGIVAASWLAVRAGVARLPARVRWSHLAGVGALAGIGFTVSLFITDLAFEDLTTQSSAKIAILAASLVASVAGAVALLLTASRGRAPR